MVYDGEWATRDDRSLFRMRLAARANRRFKFEKSRQFLLRTHNEPSIVVAMCVSNPDCSPVAIHRGHAVPTPSSFAKIVSDDFPLLHAVRVNF